MKRRSEAAAAHRVKVRPVITSGRRLRDNASASAARASSVTSSSARAGAGSGASSADTATPTSSGRSRCTGPGGSAVARARASAILSATLSAPRANVALVRGRKSVLWSMRIWTLRRSQGLETLQVKASTGAESSQAQPTPVVRLVAPGPTVAAQAPGTPVSWPTVVAMKPAEVSLAVSTNSTGTPAQGLDERQHRAAGDAEDPADSGLREHVDDGFDVGHTIENDRGNAARLERRPSTSLRYAQDERWGRLLPHSVLNITVRCPPGRGPARPGGNGSWTAR